MKAKGLRRRLRGTHEKTVVSSILVERTRKTEITFLYLRTRAFHVFSCLNFCSLLLTSLFITSNFFSLSLKCDFVTVFEMFRGTTRYKVNCLLGINFSRCSSSLMKNCSLNLSE